MGFSRTPRSPNGRQDMRKTGLKGEVIFSTQKCRTTLIAVVMYAYIYSYSYIYIVILCLVLSVPFQLSLGIRPTRMAIATRPIRSHVMRHVRTF